jgi:endonuclease YncB( thermonuclease family)
MRLLWRNHGQRPSLLPKLRSQTLKPTLLSPLLPVFGIVPQLVLLLLLWTGVTNLLAEPAVAAEILSVRSATLLHIGDQNRSFGIQLACLSVPESSQQEALSWLQKHGPRGTKVNLRPISNHDGILLAKVRVLKTGQDIGEAMVAKGLASPIPCSDDLPSS